jgi:hypothetical protein
MGLSDEGLVITLVLVWVPLFVGHFFIVRRARKLVAINEGIQNSVSLVLFILVVTLYTIACTISMYAAGQDREKTRPLVTLLSEIVWLLSPVIGTLSLIRVGKKIYPESFYIIPATRRSWILCVKRAFVFGIPLCMVFAAGDQFFREIITLAIHGTVEIPVPLNVEFLQAVGHTVGYTDGSVTVNYVIGFALNLTIGPFIDLFAPVEDSVYIWKQSMVGIALYFFYAIPEEIGWTGCLYPLMVRYFSSPSNSSSRLPVLKAMTMSGLVWGLWHCPFIILKGNPAIDSLSSFVYNILFIVSCIGTRFVLVSLVWPVAANTNPQNPSGSSLLESCTITRPSLFPAIFAHASLNVWWNFYNQMYKWSEVTGWSLLIGSEYSLLAVIWQTLIALLIVKPFR